MRGRKPLLIFLTVPLLFLLYSCGGGGSGSSFSSPGDIPGLPYSLTLLPSQTIAQTNSSIILNAKVLDGNGVPVPNFPVTFTNLSEPFGVMKTALAKLGLIKSIGILSATVANTNGLGIASVTISSTTEGFATVQSEVSNSVGVSRAKKTVVFVRDLDLAAILLLSADNPTLFEHPNDNQSNIFAVVFDRFGFPASGSVVTFGADFPFRVGADPTATCSDGSTTCSVSFPNGRTGTTNSSGQTSTLVQVDPTSLRNSDTVLNITATADNGAVNLTSLLLKPVTISGADSTLSASPEVVEVGQTSTVTAGVVLNTGAPTFDNTAVNFLTTCGSIDPFALTTGGIATATFTAPAAVPVSGICTVSASAAGVPIGPGTPPKVDITITTGLAVVPETQNIDGLAGGTATFTIFGGLPGYTVTSDNVSFPPSTGTVGASGGTFTVTVPASTPTTTVVYTIRDQAGTTVTATLEIGAPAPPDLTVLPASQTVSGISGGTATFTIFNGSAGYNVLTSNPAFPPVPTSVASSGGTFTVTVPAGTPATTVTYSVIDQAGATQDVTLNITGVALTVTPASQTVAGIGPSPACGIPGGNTASYTIIGGSPTYSVFTNRPDITTFTAPSLGDTTTVAASGGSFTIAYDVVIGPPGVDTTVTITVLDNLGATKTVNFVIDCP